MSRKEYIYKQVEGGGLLASVWYKSGAEDTGKPIALYFHGGNLVLGHKDMLSQDYIQQLLDLGFGAVVSPNYRLAPTISAAEGPVQDAKDSYLWTQTQLPELLAKDANIRLDGSRIVTLGHSAGGTLALLMASLPQKPLAILDIFGLKYLNDDFYTKPNPAFLKLPDLDQALVDRIYQDLPAPSAGPPPLGPNGPDLNNHRVAWLLTAFKKGTWLSSIVPDGNYSGIDPAALFGSSFPPTYFLHGAADTLVDVEFSRRAFEELKSNGVDTKLVVEEGAPHGFDAGSKPGEHKYELVTAGFKFLAIRAT
ncbi:Alpha/Beta hydrolase protein [Aspergillus pseudodeflectus]|uniref:Alpha/Beta hydrolase protein n=1 Tax=Aspergillus pseudodeflectus TaxID=176178 RepID=A0ABR4JCD7_9EURO